MGIIIKCIGLIALGLFIYLCYILLKGDKE